jgi:hypothetical protein
MSDKNPEEKALASLRNLVHAEIFSTEALINVLVKKGLVTREEIVEEVQAMRRQAARAGKK